METLRTALDHGSCCIEGAVADLPPAAFAALKNVPMTRAEVEE